MHVEWQVSHVRVYGKWKLKGSSSLYASPSSSSLSSYSSCSFSSSYSFVGFECVLLEVNLSAGVCVWVMGML